MQIFRKKRFVKQYQKLPTKKQDRVDKAILSFVQNPIDEKLKNHALKGEFEGLRSISAGGDLRLLFQEKNGYIEVLICQKNLHYK